VAALQADLDAVVAVGVPGVVVVARGPAGRVEAASGLADVATGEALTTEHRFRIGSVAVSPRPCSPLGAGMGLHDALHERVFAPLGLHKTDLVEGALRGECARGYLAPDNPILETYGCRCRATSPTTRPWAS
jgi:CubicO group peptidase (beta-lactamase class C family)